MSWVPCGGGVCGVLGSDGERRCGPQVVLGVPPSDLGVSLVAQGAPPSDFGGQLF